MISDERPAVLLIPGFLGSPPMYGRMASRLLARGAAGVTVAPIWTPDWLLSVAVGFGPLTRRTGRAVLDAYRRAGGRPLLVIGHSSGGVLARLATSPQPYRGRQAGVAETYGALVTLGTPHLLREAARRPFRAAHEACRYLDQTIPGAWFAPRTAYVAVGSRCVEGALREEPDLRRRTLGHVYALLAGDAARDGWGDGLILEAATHLDGARNVSLERISHGPGLSVPWYGSDEGLDGWWDIALEAWHGALRARSRMAAETR